MQRENGGRKLSRPLPAAFDSRIGFVQIGVTTVCNFDCFYCAGRKMPQRYMELELFDEILANLPAARLTVSLQGEGEPTLHPSFWDMVEKVALSGKYPYTISNCSNIDISRAACLFPQIGVSIDTLEEDEAERIGRFGLSGVLRNLEQLVATMGPRRINIYSVDYGQPLEALQRYVRSLGIDRHMVKPVNPKADYRIRYPDLISTGNERYHFGCRYIFQPSMRFFDVNGRMMPCCFIKDASKYISIEHIGGELKQHNIPDSCVGCREITVKHSMMRFLFAWEQGGRLGHLSKMLPIARILRERGHEVLFAVKEVGTAHQFLDEGFGYIQAPIPIGLKKSRREVASFADVLDETGFGDAAILGGMVRSWQTVFDLYKPDVILSQHAPTVTLAAGLFGIPCLKLSSGFESPPEISPYPCFRPWLKLTRDDLLITEQRLLDNVNQVRMDFGGSSLSLLHQAVRADVSLLATLPELDHYPGRKNGCHIGPLFISDEGESAQWPGLLEQKIFVYLFPGTEISLILETLDKCGAEVIAYIPGLADEMKEKYRTATMSISSGKLNLSGLLPEMTLAINNANLGTVSAMLMSGVPNLCIPTHIEQLMCSCSIERIGAGIGLRRDQLALRFEETLNTMLFEKRYKEKAMEISKKYAGYDQKQVVMRLANTLEQMKSIQRKPTLP